MDWGRVRHFTQQCAAWWCVVKSTSLLFCFAPPLNTRSFIWRRRVYKNTRRLEYDCVAFYGVFMDQLACLAPEQRPSSLTRDRTTLFFFLLRCHLRHINLIAACVILLALSLWLLWMQPDVIYFFLPLPFLGTRVRRYFVKCKTAGAKWRKAGVEKNAGGAVFSERENVGWWYL